MNEIIAVDFKPATGDPDAVGLRVKRRDHSACGHPKITIDEEQRTVACIACKQQLDCVWVLLQWARNWETYANHVQALRDEQRRRETEIAQACQHLRAVKSRIRRAAQLACRDIPSYALEEVESQDKAEASERAQNMSDALTWIERNHPDGVALVARALSS